VLQTFSVDVYTYDMLYNYRSLKHIYVNLRQFSLKCEFMSTNMTHALYSHSFFETDANHSIDNKFSIIVIPSSQ
jgi:hypothetical protein